MKNFKRDQKSLKTHRFLLKNRHLAAGRRNVKRSGLSSAFWRHLADKWRNSNVKIDKIFFFFGGCMRIEPLPRLVVDLTHYVRGMLNSDESPRGCQSGGSGAQDEAQGRPRGLQVAQLRPQGRGGRWAQEADQEDLPPPRSVDRQRRSHLSHWDQPRVRIVLRWVRLG